MNHIVQAKIKYFSIDQSNARFFWDAWIGGIWKTERQLRWKNTSGLPGGLFMASPVGTQGNTGIFHLPSQSEIQRLKVQYLRIFWIYPPTSNSCKWRFVGIPY